MRRDLVYKCSYYLIKIQPSCKKWWGPMQNGKYEKVVKYRWWPRKGSDGMSLTKILITTIQLNLCCFIPASLGCTKFTWIVIIKNFDQIHFAQQIWSCLVKIVVVWLWLASAFFSRRFYRPLVDIFECKVISVTVSDTVIVLERIKFWNFGLSRLDFMAMFTSNILSVTDSLANIHQKKRAKLPLTCV